MEITEEEIKMLCEKLGMKPRELSEVLFAFRNHVEPEKAAANVVDYMGTMMINQTDEEQDKMLQCVIKRCEEMLIEG